MNRIVAIFAAALFALALVSTGAADDASGGSDPSEIPDGYDLVYQQGFGGDSNLQQFRFSDPDAWRMGRVHGDAALELHQQSDYRGPHRSPRNIALIKDLSLGSFVMEAYLLQTGKEYGHRDMCVFFDFEDAAHFYYVHMATKRDEHANQIFIVNDAPRTKISDTTTDGVDWGRKRWRRVRVERDAERGTIKVYFEDMSEPIMTARDKRFQRGHVGFGSFDDTGMIDNIRIWAPDAEKKTVKPFRKETGDATNPRKDS